MPKRENTIDSSGSTTDFVRDAVSSNINSIAEETEENAFSSSSSNLITASFTNKNSKNNLNRLNDPTTIVSQPSNKRVRLDSQPQQQQQIRSANNMSVAAAHSSNGNKNDSSSAADNAQYSSSPRGAMRMVNGHTSSSVVDEAAGENGHSNNNATSSSNTSSSSSPHASYGAQAGGGEDETNAIVNLITDNANYKVMDGVQVSKTNLIVNYVPQQMSQDDLQKLFERFGMLESCKLVRDKTTNLSLGYAFVNFQRVEDAEKALSNANGMRIHNKSLKVSYARPSTEDIKGANLYVSGIPKTWTERDLKKYFYGHGRIITGRILVDNKSGLSKGVGFIRFDTREEAQSAITALNNTIPPEVANAAPGDAPVETVTVKFANNPTHTPNQPANGLVINGGNNRQQNFQQNLLAMSAAAQLLGQQQAQQQSAAAAAALRRGSLGGNPAAVAAALFGNSGGGSSVMNPLVAAAMAGRMRGNGGGSFSNSNSAGGFSDTDLLASTLLSAGGNPANLAAALLAANSFGNAQNSSGVIQQQQQTSSVNGGFAMPANVGMGGQNVSNGSSNGISGNGNAGFCLFVYNLPPDAEESLLWQLFGPFGAVQSVKIVRDNTTQRCKGFGFVTMANYTDAINAMQNLDGYSLAGRPLQVKPRTQRGGSSGGSLGGMSSFNGVVGSGGGCM